jgi:hypothetical protein
MEKKKGLSLEQDFGVNSGADFRSKPGVLAV